MQPWPRHRLARRKPLVQYPCRRLDQRTAKTRPAGRSDRQLQGVLAEDDGRRHHAAHPLPRLQRSAEEVGLAEHAVQVQVEPGHEVAGAETEAGGQDASVPLTVDGGDVGRVTGAVGLFAIEALREAQGALLLREAT